MLTYPWSKGLKIEEIEAYYDEAGYQDWTHGVTGAPTLKAQHPEFELWSQGIHAKSGVSCSDCHMPYKREGAMKISDHHIRSPLLNISRSCQPCHNIPEKELEARVTTIQDRTRGLIDRAADALSKMIAATVAARDAGATPEQLKPVLALQRRAQYRLDFVYSENSIGFHASQETARILAEAIDYARQGEVMATALRAPAAPENTTEPEPVHGVTPTGDAPPGQAEPLGR
jgi:nitrite reductase (cytochrome c-552)